MTSRVFRGLVAGLLASTVSTLLSAPPVLDGLLPAGGQQGTEIPLLIAVGKAEHWPVWCSNPGVKFTPGAKGGEFKVTIAKDATPGTCFVRLHNAEGVSEARTFSVGKLRELLEDEKVDNNSPAKATPAGALPVLVNARLDKSGDFDAWKVSLKKGQTLHARLDGYSLRSAIDPYLHVYELATGARVHLVSDGPQNLDPWLTYTAARDGDYAIAVTSAGFPAATTVEFFGAPKGVYRLTLSTNAADIREGAAPGPDTMPMAGETAEKVPLKGYGTLSKPGETDRILFAGVKGASLRITVAAVSHGFPTDPVFVLEMADGTAIREIDDDKTLRDAVFNYKVPAKDGDLVCKIRDRYHRGGPEMRYFVEITETSPDFAATADAAAYLVKAGEAATIKVKIERRDGHTAPLVATVTGLPAGVTAAPAKIAEKALDGTVELKADAKAAAFSGPIRVEVTEETGEKKLQHSAVFSFQSAEARGPYLVDEIADLWLTTAVPPPPAPAKEPEKAKEEKPKPK